MLFRSRLYDINTFTHTGTHTDTIDNLVCGPEYYEDIFGNPRFRRYTKTGLYEIHGTTIRYPNIYAEFSVTKKNTGVYIGDLTVDSKETPTIRQNSDSAREFLKQNKMNLTYTESIMELVGHEQTRVTKP